MEQLLLEHRHRILFTAFFIVAALLFASALSHVGMPKQVSAQEGTPTSTVEVTALIEPWFTLEVTDPTLDLGTLIDVDGTPFIGSATTTITVGTNNTDGYTIALRSEEAALKHQTLADNILSATAELSAGTNGYGARCVQDGDAVCESPYTGAGNNVGLLQVTDQAFAIAGSEAASDNTLLNVRAAATSTLPTGSYEDTLTLTALADL